MSLIDVDKLLAELRMSFKWHAENSRELSLLQRDINIVKEQPTVDAVPVRHGKWIDRNGAIVAPFWERYECSECGARSDNSKYCPNCGAKMDGEHETD